MPLRTTTGTVETITESTNLNRVGVGQAPTPTATFRYIPYRFVTIRCNS